MKRLLQYIEKLLVLDEKILENTQIQHEEPARRLQCSGAPSSMHTASNWKSATVCSSELPNTFSDILIKKKKKKKQVHV